MYVNNSKQNVQYLVPVASRSQQTQLYFLITAWTISVFSFWFWWLSTEYADIKLKFAINSVVLAWSTFLPAYYLYFLIRMKKSNADLPLPQGVRVAMVVTKAPSEPLGIVKKTLNAMINQQYPHDTWIADEAPTAEALLWYKTNNIQVSTRQNVTDYHRSRWPRRTKCKEGNLSYFYDMYGYDNYDIVVQMDADHCPQPGYLIEMLRPFIDPGVGYVSAPSICDANAGTSWTVRMRLYAEATLHGSLQAGYNSGWAPLCIGSHYAIRTQALKEIGGIGPELAEDHSTTFLMNAHGWRGVHAFDAVAHGDGPTTFHDCIVQEFQWSKSLTVLLLTLLPKYWKHLPGRLRFQFIFSELWYPLFAVYMLIAFTLPILALITRSPWAHVGYIEFLVFSSPAIISLILIVYWVKRNGWMRPQNAKIVRWESVFFELARWPWVLIGVLSAVREVLHDRPVEFRVTPKGEPVSHFVPMKTLVPYILIVGVSILVAIGINNAGSARGYYYFALFNAFLYLFLLGVIVGKSYYEEKK